MVRSSGHHRKRSRSRSVTPDHKRSKSSRDYDKERSRRRSRSRDRVRRSRSRDRKKDKKISESRVRSKPLKLKRRSRSRSKSKEKNLKKDEKKDIKAEDEPFDPTNLDKVPYKDDGEEWVVTDVIEETVVEDNGNLEEEYDYEADDDDQYSHRSSTSLHNSTDDVNNEKSEEAAVAKKDNKDDVECNNEESELKDENTNDKLENCIVTDEIPIKKENIDVENGTSVGEKETVTDMTSEVKYSNAVHKQKLEMISLKHKAENLQMRSHSFNWSVNNGQHSEEIVKVTKEQIRQWIKLDKELHELRVKHEVARHKAELDVIRAQLDYWKKKKR